MFCLINENIVLGCEGQNNYGMALVRKSTSHTKLLLGAQGFVIVASIRLVKSCS